ncbi:hypothetical protein WOLCODRAFT_155023 [Wolfiporia cocos MD-104 SS10]|uniref:Uncharacterized protein n=1 Tax=Wolfiporia cocos (strain MD-104) TaxID=742152 RepID=A0A2H3JS78_WOLCO|nr:hypothetical protein WOLCODRAFT_155023 [Wolfiporia cocos MD-104 SS10]
MPADGPASIILDQPEDFDEPETVPCMTEFRFEHYIPPADATKEEKSNPIARNKRKAKALSATADSTPSKATRLDTQELKITAYIHVVTYVTSATTRSAKAKQSLNIAKRGPFFFYTASTFSSFLTELAKTVPCRRDALAVSKLQWRFESPWTSKPKPLADENGYKALISSVEQRKKDHVIVVIMPPPARPEVPWDTGNGNPVFTPDDNNNNADLGSFHEQKASLDKLSAPAIAELKARYPVGSSSLYPDKHVYRDNDGNHWELDDLRLQVWAVNMARGRASLDNPPTSTHSYVQRLKAPIASASNTAVALPTASSTPPDMLINLLMLQTLQQQQQNSQNLSMLTNLTNLINTGVAPSKSGSGSSSVPDSSDPTNSSSMSEPWAVPLPRQITLEEFCARYNIPDGDHKKLELLEVELGDRRCKELDKDTWHGDAGFTKLAWDRFKEKHARFCQDIQKGLWN